MEWVVRWTKIWTVVEYWKLNRKLFPYFSYYEEWISVFHFPRGRQFLIHLLLRSLLLHLWRHYCYRRLIQTQHLSLIHEYWLHGPELQTYLESGTCTSDRRRISSLNQFHTERDVLLICQCHRSWMGNLGTGTELSTFARFVSSTHQ